MVSRRLVPVLWVSRPCDPYLRHKVPRPEALPVGAGAPEAGLQGRLAPDLPSFDLHLVGPQRRDPQILMETATCGFSTERISRHFCCELAKHGASGSRRFLCSHTCTESSRGGISSICTFSATGRLMHLQAGRTSLNVLPLLPVEKYTRNLTYVENCSGMVSFPLRSIFLFVGKCKSWFSWYCTLKFTRCLEIQCPK